MNFFGFSGLLVFITCILLSGSLLIRGRKKPIQTVWGLFCFAVSIWGIGSYFISRAVEASSALLYWQISHIGIICIPVLFYVFVQLFLERKHSSLDIAIYALGIGFLFMDLIDIVFKNTGIFIGSVTFTFNQFYFDRPPTLTYALFTSFFAAIIAITHFQLFKAHQVAEGLKRKQLQYFFLATIVGFTGGAFSFLPVFGLLIYPYLNIAIALYPLIMTLGILQYELFDIRVAIRRTLVYSILLVTLFSAYSLILFLFAQFFNLQSSANVSLFLNFLATLAIGFSFDPLRRILQERTDKFLYRKEYEQQSVLKTLSSDLNNVIGLDEALETVMQTIVKTLKIQHAITYVFQPGEGGKVQIKRIKQIGFSTEKNLLLQERDFVIEYFEQYGRTVSRAQLEEELRDEARDIRRQKPNTEGLSTLIRDHARKQTMVKRLTGLDCEAAVPLCLNNQSIGLLLLSGKLSQESFNTSDLQLLDLAGEVAISSIQKARLYEGDKMKSEFVSIASHELLTPISAIEGYLSMILDEHIGTVDEQARSYLEKVYISSRRLSQLVKDLLSVSRIESGKMTITPQAVDMQKMIHDTLDQLRFLAENKGLKLNYEASARPLPLVRADPDRVMQILINLVSNAIKYTPSGSVLITATRYRRGILKVDVKDTGFGLSKEQRLHLFEKFYRVDSPETVGIIGTGLGLYITKSILERMGGTISIESISKRGSTFSFTLPIFEAEASLPVA